MPRAIIGFQHMGTGLTSMDTHLHKPGFFKLNPKLLLKLLMYGFKYYIYLIMFV